MPRQRLTPDERRGQLLAATVRVARRRGSLEAVTGAEVAREAGMSEGLLYHHFGGKQQLQRAVLDATVDGYLDKVEALPRADALTTLTAALDTYLDCVAADRDAWALLLAPHVDPVLEAAYDRVATSSVTMIRRAFGAPRLPALLDVLVHGWLELERATCLRWATTGRPGREAVAAVLTGAFLGAWQAAVDQDPAVRRLAQRAFG